ncbi:MAG: hypothetical protein EX285_06800 [Thaumarchaeota archaeon]|nr:hypothetical protein [Nitrososphaerota archaeon]
MDGDEGHLEESVLKIILDNLKNLGEDVEFVGINKFDIEKPPYHSHLFSGHLFRMTDNMGIINMKGKNFDHIHLMRYG